MRRGVHVVALLGAMAAGDATRIGAQAPDSSRATPWQFYHGCWSTSSGGAIGPMTCFVPDTMPGGVVMLGVVGDSIVSRHQVIASGQPQAFVRGACNGFEVARWSADGQRLYMHADYRCGTGPHLTSDAMLAPTRPDAFTHVERATGVAGAPVRVVNLIVQLDTALYPDEVKRRLPSLRRPESGEEALATATPVSDAVLAEAASEVDAGVVLAWLEDRGEPTYAARLEFLRTRTQRPVALWPRNARFVTISGGRRVVFGGGGTANEYVGTAYHSPTVESTGWAYSQFMATTAARTQR